MTTAASTRKAGPFTGNGVTTSFPFAFKVFTTADIALTLTVVATAVDSTLVLDSDYSVTLNADQNASPGGSITYPLSGSPLASTHTLTAVGSLAYKQGTDIPDGGDFNASIIENALDYQNILTQQEQEARSRALTLPVSVPADVSAAVPAPTASNFLAWDATGKFLVNVAGIASVAVSSFFKTLVAAADAPALRALLGVAPRATRIDIASVAGTVDLTTNAPNTDDIQLTGGLAITGFTVAVGRVLRVTAGGAFTLTNGAGLTTQTGANIIAAVGDTFQLRATAANTVEVMNYTRTASATTPVNLIVNPGFTVNQLAYVSAAALAPGAYGHDQWKAGTGGGDYSFTQLTSNTTITIAANKTLIQVIESGNVQSASYVLSWTGTALARYSVNSATPAGSYAASPILITGQTPGSTMSVEFGNGASAGTLGSVQLAAGTAQTTLTPRSADQELALCRRYCQVIKYGLQGSATNSTTAGFTIVFNPSMYATPTATVKGTTFTLSDLYLSGYALAVSGTTPSTSAIDNTGGQLNLAGTWSPALPTAGIMLHISSTGVPANDASIVLSARP